MIDVAPDRVLHGGHEVDRADRVHPEILHEVVLF